MKEEFEKYVSGFDNEDKWIKLKHYHSYRVMDLSKLIAKYAGFNEENSKIAEIAGLLHDYGRFPQLEEYHTLNDRISVDHGDLGITKLFHDGQITKYSQQVKDYDEIFDAIKYHNKYEIPATLSEHNALLCKVIRDADKIDILYLYSSGSVELKKCDEPITPKIKEYFENEVLIVNSEKKNSNDDIIGKLSYVYDLNFRYSFEHLKKYNIIDKIFENVKDKEIVKPYFDKTKEYIDNKLKEGQ